MLTSTIASMALIIFLSLIPRPPRSPLFPYPTLFQSRLLQKLPLPRLGLLRLREHRFRGGDVGFRRTQCILRKPTSPPRKRCSDRKSTRLNSSHDQISYAVFCLKKKKRLLDANVRVSR